MRLLYGGWGWGYWMGVMLINIYPPQISCVRQLIKPNIVYKDTTGMTNHMISLFSFLKLPRCRQLKEGKWRFAEVIEKKNCVTFVFLR